LNPFLHRRGVETRRLAQRIGASQTRARVLERQQVATSRYCLWHLERIIGCANM
jgi:hypothetical protein